MVFFGGKGWKVLDILGILDFLGILDNPYPYLSSRIPFRR